jgi:hypothetical protein
MAIRGPSKQLLILHEEIARAAHELMIREHQRATRGHGRRGRLLRVSDAAFQSGETAADADTAAATAAAAAPIEQPGERVKPALAATAGRFRGWDRYRLDNRASRTDRGITRSACDRRLGRRVRGEVPGGQRCRQNRENVFHCDSFPVGWMRERRIARGPTRNPRHILQFMHRQGMEQCCLETKARMEMKIEEKRTFRVGVIRQVSPTTRNVCRTEPFRTPAVAQSSRR